MEDLLKELINSVNNLNSFSWNDFINILALIGSWITIVFLLIERREHNRPYLQVTFELVRSSLACIVLTNTGNVPLTIRKLKFDEEFIKQLPEREQKLLRKEKNDIRIFPNKKWIICLGVITSDILNKFEKKNLEISYSYSKINKNKTYNENSNIDFEQYSGFLVYVSEIDELKQVNKKIEKYTKEINQEVKKVSKSLVQYQNLESEFINSIIERYDQNEEGDI